MALRPCPTLRRRRQAGMTLLEVLVACGILVVGLASVAAMLPAAGSRLAEAAVIDRGGTLSANCFADLRTRQSFKATLFSPATTTLVIMGDDASIPLFKTPMLGQWTEGLTSTTKRYTHAQLNIPATCFELRDSVQLGPTNLPEEQLGQACRCIATVARIDKTTPVSAGTLARLSIAVFRNSTASSQKFDVTPSAFGVGVYAVPGAANTAAAARKRFLPACGAALAVPKNGDAPRWLRIASSWTTLRIDANGNTVPDVSYVCFSDAGLAEQCRVQTDGKLGALTVWGVSQLIRVDERTVALE